MKNYAKYIDPDTSKIYFMSLVDDSAFSVDSEGKLKEENLDKLPKYIQEALLMSDKMIVLPDDLSGLTKEELSELMNETPAPETPAPETPAPETPAPETPAPASEMNELPYELQIEYSAQNIKDKLISDLNGNRMYMETDGLPLYTDNNGKRKLNKNGTINNRKMVNVDVEGFNVPFYLSTGKGGKKSVASGKWYPYWGTTDGWLNKTNEEDINSYYGSSLLRIIGESLDASIGDIRNELIPEEYYNKGQWSYISEEAKRVINRDMAVSPASYYDDTDTILSTIKKNIETYKQHETLLIKKVKERNAKVTENSLENVKVTENSENSLENVKVTENSESSESSDNVKVTENSESSESSESSENSANVKVTENSESSESSENSENSANVKVTENSENSESLESSDNVKVTENSENSLENVKVTENSENSENSLENVKVTENSESSESSDNVKVTENSESSESSENSANVKVTENSESLESSDNVKVTENSENSLENVKVTENSENSENSLENVKVTENLESSDNVKVTENLESSDNVKVTENLESSDNVKVTEKRAIKKTRNEGFNEGSDYIKYTVTGTPDDQLIGFTRADLAESERFVSAYTRGAKGAISTGEPLFVTPKRVDPESGQLSFDIITRAINEKNVQSALGKVTAKESAKLKQLNEELAEGEITLPDTLLDVSEAVPVSPVTGRMTLHGKALKQAQQILKEQKLAGGFTPTAEKDIYSYSFFGIDKAEINKLFAPARATSKEVLQQQKDKEEEVKTKAQVKEVARQKKAEDAAERNAEKLIEHAEEQAQKQAELDAKVEDAKLKAQVKEVERQKKEEDKAKANAEKLIAQAEEQAQKQEEREQKEAERHEQAWLDFQVSQVKQEKAFAPEAEKLIEQAEAQELVETEAQIKEVARQKKEKEDLDAQNEKLIAQAEEQARKEEERKQKEDEKERKDSLSHLKAGMMRVIAVLGIISDVTRRILSASLSSAKETFEKQREARTVGVSLMDRRNMDIMDIAKGMEKGTTFGAISDIQTMFGDITNLDDKALERLARVMGSEIGELVRSGIGGEAPDKLLNKILNKYFEQFRQGKNSLGQYVGQEASARELTTQLRQVSPEIANIFATMVTDSLAGVFKGETVEDWQKMFDPNQSGLLQTAKEYNSEIARRYNEILAVVTDLKDNFFTNLGNELDGMLRSVSVWLNKLKPEDKQIESDVKNRQKNLESQRELQETATLIKSDPRVKALVESAQGSQVKYSVEDVVGFLSSTKMFTSLKESEHPNLLRTITSLKEDKGLAELVYSLFVDSGNTDVLTLLQQASNIESIYLPALSTEIEKPIGTGMVKDVSVSDKQVELQALEGVREKARLITSLSLSKEAEGRTLSDVSLRRNALSSYFSYNPESYEEVRKRIINAPAKENWLKGFWHKLTGQVQPDYSMSYSRRYEEAIEEAEIRKGSNLTEEERTAVEKKVILDIMASETGGKEFGDIIDYKAVENIQKGKVQQDIESLDESYPKLDTSADVSYIPSIGELESKLPVEESLGKSYTEGNKSGTLNVHLKLEKDNQTKEVALFTGVDSGLQNVKQTVFVDSGLNAMTIAEAYV